jgi:16S rRNA (cytidine1402-2'-O)-methyltransferase
MATLYLVSTPIGNLGDLTHRAEETLGSVSRVLAEDTRRTRTLMTHLGLSKPLVSLHSHNEVGRSEKILDWLAKGEDLAMVSDAGTPLVSDPGQRVVEAVLEAGFDVVPIPGPSAVLAALVGSGFPGDRFSFLGFLPRKGRERSELLDRIGASPDPVVLFESPERVGDLLEALEEICGSQRPVAVARELTKLHEEFIRGPLEEVRARVGAVRPRGEFALVVGGTDGPPVSDAVDAGAARALAASLLTEGYTPSRTAKEVANRLKISRNMCYEIVQDVARDMQKDKDAE